jgi:hypothetical protein
LCTCCAVYIVVARERPKREICCSRHLIAASLRRMTPPPPSPPAAILLRHSHATTREKSLTAVLPRLSRQLGQKRYKQVYLRHTMENLRSTEDVSTSSDTASMLNKLPAEVRNRIHSLVYHRINYLHAPSTSPTDTNILDRAHESKHAHDDDTSPLAPKTPREQCDRRTSHG